MRGNILFTDESRRLIRGAAMTAVTAAMIAARPMISRGVSRSPKTLTPITTAVTGSRAPSMAVGVEPM